ncbi:hypothetical protein ANN_11639 [Periplaneta americana]|uniref:Uncharacterized protein n=1 Tax=Periplaneta americana TaxID=6978 RepID=A0ABQ8T718_PERAM|nr:hypothetical protein ANN_11639 [Periplaneta americana]
MAGLCEGGDEPPGSLKASNLPKGLFSSGLITDTLYTNLDSPIRATCPAHPKRLDLMFLIMSAPNIFL